MELKLDDATEFVAGAISIGRVGLVMSEAHHELIQCSK